MTEAAFKATYAEWRVIKTRATVQLVFELPIERADEAYQALGGMPIAAHEVWCGIARLDPSKEHPLPPHSAEAAPRPASSSPQPLPAGENKQKRQFGEMAPSQQAGMLSQDRAFRLFLAEKFDMPIPDPDEAASIIRSQCKVKSRADIKPDNPDWSALVLAYRLWQRYPEFSDAS
jgi:hypothetical protein